METKLSFGQWVKQRRKALDMTQHALAQRIGCALSTIQKIEIDARQPSYQIAELLADHLALAPDERATFLHLARRQPNTTAPVLPVVSSPHVPSHNLLAPLTALVGREWEVATVQAGLLRSEVRLLTITGPPGIGKTRLGLQVATEIQASFANGVVFVALAPISEANFVIATIVRMFGLRDTGHQPLFAQLKAYLRHKQLLLILDNFEHVLSAAPLIAELLEAAPLLKVLVTSRALLQLYGEHEFVTPPLTLPDLSHLSAPDDLTRYAAVDLFVQRARAAKLEFVLSEQNALPVAELCVRLGGLPLAIELAAARSKQLAPEALLARLWNLHDGQATYLGVLTSHARNLPPRQQTLRNAIAWSYDLLTCSEQRIFRSMGVFAGGFTLDALHAVSGQLLAPNGDGPQVAQEWLLNTIHALVNKSLVAIQTGADEEPRFTLLEMLREYALEQLVLCGEVEPIRQAQAHYFLAMTERIEVQGKVTQSATLWKPFKFEQDNLRAALRWALAHDAGMSLYLAATLVDFWNEQGLYSETRQWLEQALTHVKPELTHRYARAAQRMGTIAWQQGDYILAQHWLNESITRWRSLGDEREVAIALHFLAMVLHNCTEYSAGMQVAQEAVALLRTQQDLFWLATALSALGGIYNAMGNYAAAHTVLEECLALFQQQGNDWGVALALGGLVDVPYLAGDYATARQYMEAALQIYRQLDDYWFISQILWYLGKICWQQGDKALAITRWEESVALGQRVGAKEFVAGSLLLLGFAALQTDDHPQARSRFAESLTIYQQMEHHAGIAYALSGLAVLVEQPTKAAQLLGAAAALLTHRRMPLDGLEHSHYEQLVVTLRAQLDEATFAAAWATGRAMTLEDAADLSP